MWQEEAYLAADFRRDAMNSSESSPNIATVPGSGTSAARAPAAATATMLSKEWNRLAFVHDTAVTLSNSEPKLNACRLLAALVRNEVVTVLPSTRVRKTLTVT